MLMASRNRIKVYVENMHYHIYNRGVEKRKIFIDNNDYAVFLNLMKRYLSVEPVADNKGREYTWLHEDIKLLAYCLMPNHFHLFVFQIDSGAMTKLMRGVCSAYTSYFNKKYNRVGPLFQDRYKASMVLNDEYYQHISRYIHLNPKNYKKWDWSSYQYYVGNKKSSWIDTAPIMELFDNDINKYIEFLDDYEGYKEIFDEIKHYVAG